MNKVSGRRIILTLLSMCVVFSSLLKCAGNKTAEESETMEDFDLKVSLERAEHSKDSNGSRKIFILKNNDLRYSELFWGFKSENRKPQNSQMNISDKEVEELFQYISGNRLNRKYTERFLSGEKRSFTRYLLAVEVKQGKGKTVYRLESSNVNEDDEKWKMAEGLFQKLKKLLSGK